MGRQLGHAVSRCAERAAAPSSGLAEGSGLARWKRRREGECGWATSGGPGGAGWAGK